MDRIFLMLLNRGIAAGWVVLAVLVIRGLFYRAPKWQRCVLWGIVAFRLICPEFPESSFSLVPSGQTLSPETVQYSPAPEIESGVSVINQALNPVIRDRLSPAPGASVNPLHVWMFLAGAAWAVGLTILLLYAFVSFLRIHRRLCGAVHFQGNIWLCDGVESPFILGVARPRIYLPSGMREEERAYVLAHERAHLKRKDHWWKLLGYVLLAVYWFHPLMWLSYALLCRDIELACDEKAVKTMSLEGKKAYSHALVSSSVGRKIISACPLAFGEVGVKARVKAVLNYQKPAFWVILGAAFVCIVSAVCFLTNPREDSYKVRIVIPAGSEGGMYYSDEEISPYGNKITLWASDGLGDTEVTLLPSDPEKESLYAPIYLTPGMPVRMEAEKGEWFRIGVNVSNLSEEEKSVYVKAEGVQIRIPSGTNEIEGESTGTEDGEDEADLTSDLDTAIQTAILEKNTAVYAGRDDFRCCDFLTLAAETNGTVTCYGWAMYQEYRISENGIEDLGGSHIPAALTFEEKDGRYQLIEYWEPRSGSYYVPDIRSKFPEAVAEDGIDSQKFVLIQIQRCYEQAVESAGLDTDRIIDNLLKTVCSSPQASSNPQDYIEAHEDEYRTLAYYGDYTLRYCSERLEKGKETGLEGRIMELVCGEIQRIKGQIP